MDQLTGITSDLQAVLKGEKKIGVEARLNDRDLLKMTGAIFVAFFLAVLLANAITK